MSLAWPKVPIGACVLSPDSPTRRLWDLWMVVLLGYVAIAVPLRLGFDMPTEPSEFWFWFEALVDVNFVVDIVLNFRTAFIDSDGFTVDEPRRIARRYSRGWFLVDLLSSLPVSYVQLAAEGGDVQSSRASSNLRVAKMLRLLRLAKMLRLARVAAIFERYAEDLEAVSNVMTVMKSVFLALLMAHLCACSWWYIGDADDDRRDRSWMDDHAPLRNASLGTQYTSSLYFATSTLANLGYGDIVPESDIERWFVVLVVLSGSCTMGYIVATLVEVIVRDALDPTNRHRIEKLAKAKQYMKQNGVSAGFRRRVRAHLLNSFEERGEMDEREVLAMLPPKMAQDVCWQVHLPILRIIAGGKIFGTDTDAEARKISLSLMSEAELHQISRAICAEISGEEGMEEGLALEKRRARVEAAYRRHRLEPPPPEVHSRWQLVRMSYRALAKGGLGALAERAASYKRALIERIVAREQQMRERDPMLLDLVVNLENQYVTTGATAPTAIVENGCAGTELYIILRGECEVLDADGKPQDPPVVMGQGECFGEQALLKMGGGPVGRLVTNTVVARCDSCEVKLGVLSLVKYRALCREYPTLELKLKRGYTQRLFSRSNLKNHFFLSHYQANGGNTVASLYEKLGQLHIRCWLDNQQHDRSERGMMDGIKHSAVFLLFLTKGTMARLFVQKELREAFRLRKPIMLVAETDARFGAPDFREESTTPAKLDDSTGLPILSQEQIQWIFSEIVAIPMRRELHEEPSMTAKIERDGRMAAAERFDAMSNARRPPKHLHATAAVAASHSVARTRSLSALPSPPGQGESRSGPGRPRPAGGDGGAGRARAQTSGLIGCTRSVDSGAAAATAGGAAGPATRRPIGARLDGVSLEVVGEEAPTAPEPAPGANVELRIHALETQVRAMDGKLDQILAAL